MGVRLLSAVLPLCVAGSFGLQSAHADIYKWVDKSGTVTYSNAAPPSGIRVTEVIRERKPAPAADPPSPVAADAVHEAELRAMELHIRQLELELAQLRRDGAEPLRYGLAQGPAWRAGCDPNFMDCGVGFSSSGYPATVVVVGSPFFRRLHAFHPAHRFLPVRTGRVSSGMHSAHVGFRNR